MSTRLRPGADAPTDDETETGLADFLAGEPAARAWLQVFEAGSLYRGWHPADAEWTLETSHKLLRRLGGRIGPGGAKGFWPAMLDVEVQASTRRRIAPSEVSAMDAAVGWAWAHLGADRHENERRAVQRWCFCVETGASYTKFLREGGYVRQTEQTRRRRGLIIIAAALCRAEMRIPREVLVARLERARSDVRGDAPDELAVAAQAGELPPTTPVPLTEAPLPILTVIDGMWRDAALCGLLAPVAQGPAVLALLHDRARLEAACGVISNTGPGLSARVAQLRAEAAGRGLLAADARQGGGLSRSDLTARIERNRENSDD